MKKSISVLLAFMFSLLMLNCNVLAYDTPETGIVVLEDLGGFSKSSALNILSSNTAECISGFRAGSNNISSVRVEQILEKHWALGMFFSVSGASWDNTYYTNNVSVSNYKYNLESGTYRLKTVFTVVLSNNQSETVTVYSGERTV